MGTHPIFESDFDCLTEISDLRKYAKRRRKNSWISTSHENVLHLTDLSAQRINPRSNSISSTSTQPPVACSARARLSQSAVPSDEWVNLTIQSIDLPGNAGWQNNSIY